MKSKSDDDEAPRVRITANLPARLAALVNKDKRPGESSSEAICRLVETGLMADVALQSAGHIKRSQKNFESIALLLMKEMKQIKQEISQLRAGTTRV